MSPSCIFLLLLVLCHAILHAHCAITSTVIRDEPVPPEQDVNEMLKQVQDDGQPIPPGELAINTFCTCEGDSASDTPTSLPSSSSSSSDLCSISTSSCISSLCQPLCLDSAWDVAIDVDCGDSKLAAWKHCNDFKAQVIDAKEAVAAQFKAHICLQAGFCKRDSKLIDYVENHTFGHSYPQSLLPISACLSSFHDTHPMISQQTCKLCSEIVHIQLIRGECNFGDRGDVMSSVQQRCEFIADYVTSHAAALLKDIQNNICHCLGCCHTVTEHGKKQCYFPNVEEKWLNNLIESVTHNQLQASAARQQKKEEAIKQKRKQQQQQQQQAKQKQQQQQQQQQPSNKPSSSSSPPPPPPRAPTHKQSSKSSSPSASKPTKFQLTEEQKRKQAEKQKQRKQKQQQRMKQQQTQPITPLNAVVAEKQPNQKK